MTDSLLPIDRTALATKQADVQAALAKLRELPCLSLEEEQFFDEIFNKAHRELKTHNGEREELKKPSLEEGREIDGAYKPLLDAYKDLKELAGEKVRQARTARALASEQARNRAIEAATAAQKASGEEKEALTLACSAALSEVQEVAGGWEWSAGIVNQFDVPREFLEISTSAVKAYCAKYRNCDTIPSVAGLNFTRRATVRAK